MESAVQKNHNSCRFAALWHVIWWSYSPLYLFRRCLTLISIYFPIINAFRLIPNETAINLFPRATAVLKDTIVQPLYYILFIIHLYIKSLYEKSYIIYEHVHTTWPQIIIGYRVICLWMKHFKNLVIDSSCQPTRTILKHF